MRFAEVPRGALFIHPTVEDKCRKLITHTFLRLIDVREDGDEWKSEIILDPGRDFQAEHCFIFEDKVPDHIIYYLHPDQEVELVEPD